MTPSSLATCAAGTPDCTLLHASSLNSILYVCAIILPPDFMDRLYHSFYLSIKWGIRQTVVHAVMVDRQKAALPLLSDGEQALIKAIFFEGLSEKEAGLRLGVTQSVVNKRKSKILAKLRKIMENKI